LHKLVEGLEKYWKHYTYCKHFFIDMLSDYNLPSMEPQSCLECTHTSFEQSVMEFYAIHLEGHLQVSLEILGGGNLLLTLVPKTDQSGSVMFKSGDCAAGEDCEVQLYALKTMNDQFQLCE
jgi:hypothetical protein